MPRIIDAEKIDFPIEYGRYRDSWEEGFDCALHACIDAVDEVPVFDPVRHGRWVKLTGAMPPEYFGRHFCSLCESAAPYYQTSNIERLSPWCPECGAQMDKYQASE